MTGGDARTAQLSGDSGEGPKRTKVNRRSSERYRASQLFAEKWTNAKAGLIGFMTGQGRTSTDIVEHLGDGTNSATVRALWKKWGLPIDKTGGRRRGHVPVALTIQQRKVLSRRAKGVGVKPEEYLRRIAACAIEDDLYAAVTDGKFDPKPATASTV